MIRGARQRGGTGTEEGVGGEAATHVTCVLSLVKRDLDVGLGSKVVDLSRLDR